jgi:riboflavin synthase
VNLERPVTLVARLGGHLVQGHVDGVGQVTRVEVDGSGGAHVSIRVPGELSRYVVERGSIAIDGVSLTIAAVDDDEITVALIPHTLAVTTLGLVAPGRRLNVEADVIARYVERSMERSGR